MKHAPSVHYNSRPAGIAIDTVVIHAMHAPQSSDPYSPDECVALLDHHKVSAHFFIDRKGEITQCVDPLHRAWHAGASKMPFSDDARENVNDFSVGIELIGQDREPFTEEQYRALQKIISDLGHKYPIRSIVGHHQVAPGRKQDPGPSFDWEKLKLFLKGLPLRYCDAI